VPTVALVHDNFAGPTGMGLVLNRHAHFVLDAGWDLVVVGDNVPSDIRSAAAHVVPARKPRGLPALPEHLEWCRRARRGLQQVSADIVHVHSPFLTRLADLQTSHFVRQAAFVRNGGETSHGAEATLRRAQASVTRQADQWLYRRERPRTYLSFVSEFLRDEFRHLYGEPRGGWIFHPPAPCWRPPSGDERARARAAFGVPEGQLVVGYLGGADARKGYHDVLGLQSESDLHVLFAGPGSEKMLFGEQPGIGFVEVGQLLFACDVVAAPTYFDPAPVAVLEGLARGVPVVTTSASGWATAVERHGCGVVWQRGRAALADACRQAASASRTTCRSLLDEVAPARLRAALIAAYEQILGAAAA
jgi:glycosyltransferase involved in cell wall biosynthesis